MVSISITAYIIMFISIYKYQENSKRITFDGWLSNYTNDKKRPLFRLFVELLLY